ncbi:Fe2+-dependent dioxygenase [Paenalcaligenes faecalis]|uniref:Fe2+-dependent dioxygenase n=1 Tax=Paenalcaligenes faecalis TaxID=2980099 RepID=UPI0022B9B72E|nr:Fe2+-dependent dioxygenase [Paenalcaligenes faecalis]
MLIIIPQVLNAEQVQECREALFNAQWENGKKTAGYLAQHVKANLQLPVDCIEARQIGDFLLHILQNNPTFVAAALPAKILPPRFNCYQGGGSYGNHIDNAIFPIIGTEHRLRTDVSSTLFFSDPAEYEGGELVIEDTYGSQSIKLNAGDMVVYPGTSLHRVNPVTKGTRLASFFWSQSMVRQAHKRSMLWELDQSIQAIAAQDSTDPQLARLSGVYHNLLREWAEI